MINASNMQGYQRNSATAFGAMLVSGGLAGVVSAVVLGVLAEISISVAHLRPIKSASKS